MQSFRHSVRLATVPDRHEPACLERTVPTSEASWLTGVAAKRPARRQDTGTSAVRGARNAGGAGHGSRCDWLNGSATQIQDVSWRSLVPRKLS
jgi:hypothetical protein